MRIKIVVIAIVLLLVIAVPMTFATGVGAAFSLPIGDGLPGTDIMLSLKTPKLPFLMGFGFSLDSDIFQFGLTGDWWVANSNLFSFINYYLGPGFYLGFDGYIQLGGRFPIGLNVYPIKNLELFVEIAPTLFMSFNDPISFPLFGAQSAFGLRFWF